MKKNYNLSQTFEDEIDPLESIKLIFESKILIISFSLIFTVSAALFSLSLKPYQISTMTIEIGHFKKPDGTVKFFDHSEALINKIRESTFHRNQNVILRSIGESLILFQAQSHSIEENERALNIYLEYIEKIHNETSINNRKKKLLYEFKTLSSILSNIENTNPLNSLNNEDLEFLFNTKADLKSLEGQIDLINQKDYKKTNLRGEISTIINAPNREIIIIIGLLAGLFSGIFYVLIRNIFKNSKNI